MLNFPITAPLKHRYRKKRGGSARERGGERPCWLDFSFLRFFLFKPALIHKSVRGIHDLKTNQKNQDCQNLFQMIGPRLENRFLLGFHNLLRPEKPDINAVQ